MSPPKHLHSVLVKTTICIAAGTTFMPAMARAQAIKYEHSAKLEEVIVSARKRDETTMDVPVAISAISGETIEQQGLSNLEGIAARVPSLNIGSNIVGFGGSLTLRGVSSATSTASIEQAVTVNIDGIPISYAGVVRLGQFDIGSVEVLKGPQALFFGKNASGGIVSMQSAEPTTNFEALVRAGYESEAREFMQEVHVSGPITENLLGRLAVQHSSMDGWIDNKIPAGTPGSFGPTDRKSPGSEDLNAKAALTFTPQDDLEFKFKAAYSDLDTQSTSLAQRYHCPTGTPQGPSTYPGHDCKLDDETASGDLNPALHAFDDRFPSDGEPYAEIEQRLVVGEINYSLTDELTLSSITGYYDMTLDTADHVNFGPIAIINFADSVQKTSYSEELRLLTDFSGPLNGMVGVFYQDDTFEESERIFIGPSQIPFIGPIEIKGKTISPFVQAEYAVTDEVTVSGGVRYTDETKEQHNKPFGAQLKDEVSFYNLSPELTVSYKPTSDLNLYVSYKEGYKSGGFQTEFISIPSALTAGATVDNSYAEETVKGFEVGAKTALLDSTLRLNVAAYRYEYSDLQLGRFDPVLVTTVVENIGSSTTRGVEADFEYLTPINGLSITGAAAFNLATYDEYIAACYTGQSAAAGCTGQGQDLAGESLPRAPKWTGNIGALYVASLSDAMELRLNSTVRYTDDYEMMSELVPGSKQDGFTTIDAGVALNFTQSGLELAFIGKNLTDEFYGNSAGQVPITGSATTGSDIFTTVSRGRELWFRLSYRVQ